MNSAMARLFIFMNEVLGIFIVGIMAIATLILTSLMGFLGFMIGMLCIIFLVMMFGICALQIEGYKMQKETRNLMFLNAKVNPNIGESFDFNKLEEFVEGVKKTVTSFNESPFKDKTSPVQPNASATCPNCECKLMLDSKECWNCKAVFNDSTEWKPKAT
jgi:hypothetical protein